MMRCRQSARAGLLVLLVLQLSAAVARAWDSHTHQLIAALALEALPSSPLKETFSSWGPLIEKLAIEPDTVLRPKYGDAEARRHYIDLEYFGRDPFTALDPDYTVMRRKFGERILERSGTLPWAIESEAVAMASAWRAGDCDAMLHRAGYLAHYVGDASQPLHSTKDFDGPAPSDRGMHARLEAAADRVVRRIAARDAGKQSAQPITSIWPPVIAELRQANGLIAQIVANDRALRGGSGMSEAEYDKALMDRELPLLARQVGDAAEVLSSIWLFEWRQAGQPATCERH
jgi:hypothetical protein